MRRGVGYTEEEVQALIKEYEAVRESSDTTRRGLRYLVQIADLNKALEQLPLKYWEVVLLHGLLGVPQQETAQLLQVSQQAVGKRYRRGLEEVVYLINGGD